MDTTRDCERHVWRNSGLDIDEHDVLVHTRVCVRCDRAEKRTHGLKAAGWRLDARRSVSS